MHSFKYMFVLFSDACLLLSLRLVREEGTRRKAGLHWHVFPPGACHRMRERCERVQCSDVFERWLEVDVPVT